LKGSKIDDELFDRLLLKRTTPSTLRGHNSLLSNMFLSIFNVTYVPRRRLHVLFEHHKQWGPPTKNNKQTLH
jgi:hypothetical protein